MNIPHPSSTNGHTLPYVIVADEIFGLEAYPGKGLSKSEAVFNQGLSRVRSTIENAFRILAARWQFFCKPIKGNATLLHSITKACLCLHN